MGTPLPNLLNLVWQSLHALRTIRWNLPYASISGYSPRRRESGAYYIHAEPFTRDEGDNIYMYISGDNPKNFLQVGVRIRMHEDPIVPTPTKGLLGSTPTITGHLTKVLDVSADWTIFQISSDSTPQTLRLIVPSNIAYISENSKRIHTILCWTGIRKQPALAKDDLNIFWRWRAGRFRRIPAQPISTHWMFQPIPEIRIEDPDGREIPIGHKRTGRSQPKQTRPRVRKQVQATSSIC